MIHRHLPVFAQIYSLYHTDTNVQPSSARAVFYEVLGGYLPLFPAGFHARHQTGC